ncbi:MAG: hypothetical protein LCH87_16065 [Actinobacteria bacterium]|nr:hypothetical protein [Actinomycetota bacterium]
MRLNGTLGAEGYRTLWQATVIILGVVLEQTRVRADGIIEPVDFADFLASALAAVAANAGSVERLTAGRPGSWESSLVNQLVCGTVGHDPADLARHRTDADRDGVPG